MLLFRDSAPTLCHLSLTTRALYAFNEKLGTSILEHRRLTQNSDYEIIDVHN
jgi:hypothetical protein